MHWFWASATLASAAGAAQVVTTPRQFEVDIVFPHNETYKPADTMPVVFAIQNITVPRSIGTFQVEWEIMSCPGGQFNENTSSEITWGVMQPVFATNETAADTTLFLVDFTNVTEWVQWGQPIPPATEYKPAVDDRYLLQWYVYWTDLPRTCPKSESLVGAGVGKGALMFNIQTVWGKEGSGWQGEIHDVQETIPECPEFGARVQIGPAWNATRPECPMLELLETRQGNPCAVKVDQAAVSSISSRVSSSVSSSVSKYHPTATTTRVVASSTSKAGVGPARTVQTALAAACVLCGLAL